MAREGRIPQSVNLPSAWIFTKEGAFKTREDLEAMAAPGINCAAVSLYPRPCPRRGNVGKRRPAEAILLLKLPPWGRVYINIIQYSPGVSEGPGKGGTMKRNAMIGAAVLAVLAFTVSL